MSSGVSSARSSESTFGLKHCSPRFLRLIFKAYRNVATGLIVLALFSVTSALSATITVTSLADSGAGSLRDTIAAAAPGDTIDFSLPPPVFPATSNTITLASALTINKNLTITGPGASSLAISGNNSFRIFFVPFAITANISGVTIEKGFGFGGGILNQGTLTLTDSTVSGNSTTGEGGGIANGTNTLILTNSIVSGNSANRGGGILNEGGTLTLTNSTVSGNSAGHLGGGIYNQGTLTLTDSTVSGNSASQGGGIANRSTFTLTNSTVSGNSSSDEGGGIFSDRTSTLTNSTVSGNSSTVHGGGIANSHTLTLNNSTVSGNSAFQGGGIGDGIFNPSAVTVKNTTVANNPTGGNCFILFGTTITSHGHNLSDTACSFFTAPSDLVNTPAGLDPSGLQNNGGPTDTIALLTGSPAIDAVPLVDCSTVETPLVQLATDQRGTSRPFPIGGNCDIGAYELDNNPPVITSVNGPLDAIAIGTLVTIPSNFTDADALDTHTCTVSWGDGPTEPGVVLPEPTTSLPGVCTDSHTYSDAGVYTVEVTVTDDDGASDTDTFQYVVIYDPSAGFVTGGGWINSPAGAYTADPSLTGKAAFGFVSKYLRGRTTPSGETEFQFKAGNLNFHSSTYEWLVVSGARAQYKGTGTINGAGNYNFLLTAIDGQLSGGGGVDKFRIKITGPGGVVYDNQPGAGDNENPSTSLGGGSIVIHR